MRVAKWGNSLALRLPAKLVKDLELVEGDEVEVRPAGAGTLGVSRDVEREWAVATIRRLRRSLPEGYKFDRDEANER